MHFRWKILSKYGIKVNDKNVYNKTNNKFIQCILYT